MSESETQGNGRVTVGAKIAEEKRRRLRVYAAKNDTTVSGLLRNKIDEILQQEDSIE